MTEQHPAGLGSLSEKWGKIFSHQDNDQFKRVKIGHLEGQNYKMVTICGCGKGCTFVDTIYLRRTGRRTSALFGYFVATCFSQARQKLGIISYRWKTP
jgi:hypothetical protein